MTEPVAVPQTEHAYWARFQTRGGHVFRFDTRIYLCPVFAPTPEDRCVGAVVGKNPGSAKAADSSRRGLQRIRLDGDRLLPTVRSLVLKAYRSAEKPLCPGDYLQVLNLFYLCDPNLREALRSLESYRAAGGRRLHCPTEGQTFPWVWCVWGGANPRLAPLKARFARIRTGAPFYFDKNTDTVVERLPTGDAFARHTQGLKHDTIAGHLARLV